MAIDTINIGALANDGTGDAIRDAFDKVNTNFTDVQDQVDTLTNLVDAFTSAESPCKVIKAYRSNVYNVSGTGAVKIPMDTYDDDDTGVWDSTNSRAVIKNAGVYLMFYLRRSLTSLVSDAMIAVNGSLVATGSNQGVSALSSLSMTAQRLEVGDYVEPYVYYSGSYTLQLGSNYPFILLGPLDQTSVQNIGTGVTVKTAYYKEVTPASGMELYALADTAPTASDGNVFSSQTYTPSAISNKLKVTVKGWAYAPYGVPSVWLTDGVSTDAVAVETGQAAESFYFSLTAVTTADTLSEQTWTLNYASDNGMSYVLQTDTSTFFGDTDGVLWSFEEMLPDGSEPNTTFPEVLERLTTAEEEIDTLQTSAAATATQITTLQTGQTALGTRMTAAEASITDLDTRVTDIEENGTGGGGISLPDGSVDGDLFFAQDGALARLPVGTNGQSLSVVDGYPAYTTPDAGDTGPRYSLVGSATVTSTAADYLEVTGMDLDSDQSYFVEFELRNASTSSAIFKWFLNADTTDTNYRVNYVTVADSETSGVENTATIQTVDAGQSFSGSGRLAVGADNRPRAVLTMHRQYNTNAAVSVRGIVRLGTDSVISLRISSDTTGAVDVGSWVKVYRFASTEQLELPSDAGDGALLYANNAALSALNVGSDGQFLSIVDGLPSYVDVTAESLGALPAPASLTAGAIFYYDGSTIVQLPIGTNGQFLMTNGTAPYYGTVTASTVGAAALPSGIQDGDILYISSGVLARLAKGTDGQVLSLASGIPVWTDAASGTGDVSFPTGVTEGDLFYYDTDSSDLARIPVGTDGQTLTMVSGTPAWADPSGGITLPSGSEDYDLFYALSGELTRLPIGAEDQQLSISSGAPTWVDPVEPVTYENTGVGGVVVRHVTYRDTTGSSTTLTIASGTEVPQITDGEEFETHVYSAKVLGNTVSIRVVGWTNNTSAAVTVALFRVGSSDAVATTWGDGTTPFTLAYDWTVDTLDETSWMVRFGGSAGTSYVIATSSGDYFGTSDAVTWDFTEYSNTESTIEVDNIPAMLESLESVGGPSTAVKAYRATGYPMTATSAWTKVPLDGVLLDPKSLWDSTYLRVNIKREGTYIVNYTRYTTTTVSGAAGLMVNGEIVDDSGTADSSLTSTASTTLYLYAGDYVEPAIYLSEDLTLAASSTKCFSVTGPLVSAYQGAQPSGRYDLVGSVLLSSVSNTMSISGLDLDSDLVYDIEIGILGNGSSGSTLVTNLTHNTDTTDANYYSQKAYFSGTSTTFSSSASRSMFGLNTANAVCVVHGKIFKAPDGTVRFHYQSNRDIPSAIGLHFFTGSWSSTANLTTYTLTTTTANGYGIGSFIRIYKKSLTTSYSKTLPVLATASEACVAGLVNIYSNGSAMRIRQASCTDPDRYANGAILASVVSGSSINVYCEGEVDAFTGLVPGRQYHLGTSGTVTYSPATATGYIIQRAGFAISDSKLRISFGDPVTIS